MNPPSPKCPICGRTCKTLVPAIMTDDPTKSTRTTLFYCPADLYLNEVRETVYQNTFNNSGKDDEL